jgi:cytoskeletal protein RodZ
MKTEENQQIADNSLGQILREKRQFLKMEVAEISIYLKIKSRDIEAIENDDLKHVAKHLYVPGLIRSYAKFLKIDPKLIEKKIKVLPIASNTENKKHQLLNIGESDQLSPNKDSVFNFLLISILLFLALLLLYNSFQNNNALITNEKLIHELENIDF